MALIDFRRPAGHGIVVEAAEGISLMALAVTNGIDEVVAECGGSLACGTCHVYIEAGVLADLPAMTAAEDQMLDFIAGERRPGSRLSCQIIVTRSLDGMVVELPTMVE